MDNSKRPSFAGSVLSIVVMAVLLSYSILVWKVDPHIPLILGTLVAALIAMQAGFKWAEVQEGILAGCNLAMLAMLILMIVGSLIGSWVTAGVVPAMIFYGLKIMSPSFFLVAGLLLCCVVSVSTGSSWTTTGTVGVALMGIGAGLGIPAPITAGMIVSGAYFGDKMSPLSDSTNLAAAVGRVNLFEHIKWMMYTTVPGLVVAGIIYGIIGSSYSAAQLDMSQINTMLGALEKSFNINLWLFIPPILVIVMAARRMPAIPALIIGILVGGLFAMIFQGATIAKVLNSFMYGYSGDSGVKAVDKLLNRGGLYSMMWTVSLGFIALSFGGVLERTKMLEVILTRISVYLNNAGKVITSTVIACVFTNFLTASQYLAIIIPGRMLAPVYTKLKLAPKNLSRTLEDAGTLVSPLVPWGLCGVFVTGALGVPTIEYAPYALLSLIVPVIAIIYGFTGFAIAPLDEGEGETADTTAINIPS